MEYIADTKEDLLNLPKVPMGSTCFVIAESITYMCNSKHEWIALKSSSGSGGSGGITPDDTIIYDGGIIK